MPVTDSFIAFVAEQLEAVGIITPKRLFGGAGLYADDVFFALLSDDTLYLKVGDSNRADFVAAGMGPFEPPGHPGLVMQYYEVPVEVLEDADELGRWAMKAIAAAVAKKTKRKATTKVAKLTKKTRKAKAGNPAKKQTRRQ